MAQITIHRGKHYYMGIFPWRVFIDGQIVGKVLNGKDLSIDIPDGRHEMQVAFLGKWLHSNKLIFDSEKDKELELSVSFHSLWNFGYRRPEFFVSRESMVLLPVNEHSKDYFKAQEQQRKLYYDVFLKAVKGSKIDILIHILYLLFAALLIVFFKNAVVDLYDWLALNILAGLILFFVYRYDHHVSVFGLLSSTTLLLGYNKNYPLVGIVAILFFATFVVRFVNRYKHFKKELNVIKKEDIFLGEFNITK